MRTILIIAHPRTQRAAGCFRRAVTSRERAPEFADPARRFSALDKFSPILTRACDPDRHPHANQSIDNGEKTSALSGNESAWITTRA